MILTSGVVASCISGRIRLRHPALKRSDLMDALYGFLVDMDGVSSVQPNPVTGSLLVFYDPGKISGDGLLALAEQGAAFLSRSAAVTEKDGMTCASLGKALLGRTACKTVDRVLLASLLLSLGGAACGVGALHKAAGVLFALACVQHVAAHRKLL